MALIDPATPAGVMPVGDTTGAYTLAFSDEFATAGVTHTPDPTKWITALDYLPGLTDAQLQQVCEISNGTIKLFRPKNGDSIAKPGDNSQYGTYPDCIFNTSGKFMPSYGYFEVSMKSGTGLTLWPGAWRINTQTQREVDLSESYGTNDPPWGQRIGGILHLVQADINMHRIAVEDIHVSRTSVDVSAGFVTLGHKHEPGKHSFFINGVQVSSHGIDQTGSPVLNNNWDNQTMALAIQHAYMSFFSDAGQMSASDPAPYPNATEFAYARFWNLGAGAPVPAPAPGPAPSPAPAPTPAPGTQLFVSPTGLDSNNGTSATTPFKTITKAASVAVAGQTINFADGTYIGSVATNAGGAAGSPIIYKSTNKWGAKIVPPVSGSNIAWIQNGNYVEIDGFDIDGQSNGVWRIGPQHVGSHCKIRNCHVHHIGIASICDSDGGAGILNEGSHIPGQTDCEIGPGNVVHHIGPTGCTTYNGIYVQQDGNKIHDNIVHNVTGDGIVSYHDAQNVDTYNNTVFKCQRGIVNSGGGFYNRTSVSNFRNYNNIVYQCVGNGFAMGGAINGVLETKNNFSAGNGGASFSVVGTTGGNISSGTPGFVNYLADGTGDYRLVQTSVCVNSGSNVLFSPTDAFGNTRPQGITPDMGYYEFTAAAPAPAPTPTPTPAPAPLPPVGTTSAANIDPTTPDRQMPHGDTTGQWNLNFSEEFNSNAASLDATKWKDRWHLDAAAHSEVNYDQNAGGNSCLRVWPPASTPTTGYPPATFGANPDRIITTDGLYHQTFGFIEARFQAPKGTGTLSNIWLLNYQATPNQQTDLCRTQCGNVTQGYAAVNAATGISFPIKADMIVVDNTGTRTTVAQLANPDFSAGKHVVGVKWLPDGTQQGYFDGVVQWTSAAQLFNEKHINISLSYEGGANQVAAFSATNPPRGNANPFKVDWVRGYVAGAPNLIFYPLGPIDPLTPAGTMPFGDTTNLYSLAFSDEFSLSGLHVGKWKEVIAPTVSDIYKNFDVNRNQNSMLSIWPDGNFVPRNINTDGLFLCGPQGYYEMRAVLPKGKGPMPLFYLFNRDTAVHPRIDVMQAFTGAPFGSANLPKGFRTTIYRDAAVSNIAATKDVLGLPDLSAGLHYFAVKIELTTITILFDGQPVLSIPNPFQPNQQFFMVCALDYGSVSGTPDDTTPISTPNAFGIESVRGWNLVATPDTGGNTSGGGGYSTTMGVWRNVRYR